MVSCDLRSWIINRTTLQHSCLLCNLLPDFSVLNKIYPTYGDFKLCCSKENEAVTTLSEGDVWHKAVVPMAFHPCCTLGVLVWICVWPCTHLPVYFPVERILSRCSKTAPQHRTEHSLSKRQPAANSNADIPGDSLFS